MTDDSDNDTLEREDAADGPEAPAPEAPAEAEKSKRARGKVVPDATAPASFTMPVSDLRAALKGLTDVVETRNTIPILSNVLLELAPSRLTLTATDLDIWLVRHVDVENEGELSFATTVGAKLVGAIAAKLPAEATVTISYDGRTVSFKAGRAQFKLPVLPADDFARPTNWDALHQFEVAAFDLAAMLGATRFAIGADETRYYLMGMYLHAATGSGPTGDGDGTLMVLRGATTDGSRLARFDIAQPDGAGGLGDESGGGALVPRKMLATLDKLLDGYERMVDIAIGDRGMIADLGDTVVWSKLIDGSFPAYMRVIPTGNDRLVTFDPKAMIEAIGRVGLMAEGKSHALKLSLARDVIVLSAKSPEHGEASEELPCDYDGAPLDIGFNGAYLTQVCQQLQGDSATLAIADAAGPTLLRDANVEARGLFVLMPMRV